MCVSLILVLDRNECSTNTGEGASIIGYEIGCRVFLVVGVTKDVSALLLESDLVCFSLSF